MTVPFFVRTLKGFAPENVAWDFKFADSERVIGRPMTSLRNVAVPSGSGGPPCDLLTLFRSQRFGTGEPANSFRFVTIHGNLL